MKHVLLLALALVVSAAAQTPRTIDFTQPLISIVGKPMLQDPKDPASAITLGDAAVLALETATEDDKGASGEDKFKRDQLARKIYGKKDVALTVEEIALIKTRIGKVETPAVVGAAWPLLDPASGK